MPTPHRIFEAALAAWSRSMYLTTADGDHPAWRLPPTRYRDLTANLHCVHSEDSCGAPALHFDRARRWWGWGCVRTPRLLLTSWRDMRRDFSSLAAGDTLQV
jgi:hypothetical protein